jgi:hypothetical protein
MILPHDANPFPIVFSERTPTSSQHDDLLPQHEDLGFQRRARSDQIEDNPKNYSAEIQHPAEDHPILRLTPTGWNLRQGQGSEVAIRPTI